MLLTKDVCINALRKASGDTLSLQDAKQKAQAVQSFYTRAKLEGLDDATALSQATTKAMNLDKLAAARAKADALSNLLKRTNWDQDVLKRGYDIAKLNGRSLPTAADRYDAWVSKITGTNYNIENGQRSIQMRQYAAYRNSVGAFVRDLEKANLLEAYKSGRYDRNILIERSELNKGDKGNFGKTVDAQGKPDVMAHQIAKMSNDYLQAARLRMNAAGAHIGDLFGYGTRNEHNWEKINSAGFQQWSRDFDKAYGNEQTYLGMDEMERADYKRKLYDVFVSGEHFNGGGQGLKGVKWEGKGNIARYVSGERDLHPTDAASQYEYLQKYGDHTRLLDSDNATLGRTARLAPIMEELGTNGWGEFENRLRREDEHFVNMKRDDMSSEVRKFNDDQEKLHKLFDQVSGRADIAKNRLTNSLGEWARTIEFITKGGSIVIPHAVTSPVLRALAASHWGGGVLENYIGGLTDSFTKAGGMASKEARDMLDGIGALNDGTLAAVHQLIGTGRGGPGVAASLSNIFSKLTLLPQYLKFQRAGYESWLARHVGRNLDSDFNNLKPEMQASLKTYGLNAEDWDLLRKAEAPTVEGRNYLTPDMADKIDPAGVESLLRQRGVINDKATPATVSKRVDQYKEELAQTISGMYANESRRALNLVSARSAAKTVGQFQKGSIPGELMRTIMQFKQWPVELMFNTMGREIYGNLNKTSAAMGVFHFAAMMTVAGYVRLAVQNLLTGNAPPKLDNPQILFKSMQEGGATALMGDLMFGSVAKDSGLADIEGPVASDADKLLRIWHGYYAGEKNTSKQLETFALQHMPLQNLAYTKLLTNYLFMWHLHDMINPGWSQRYNSRIEKETGSRPFIGPASGR